MNEPKIKDKPTYCSAWVSKISDKVLCNSIPCCGFCIHGRTDRVTKGFEKFVNDVGRHPLVNGKFVFNDGTIHNPKKESNE